jgi:two-component system sensor histidine kinase/response regulator
MPSFKLKTPALASRRRSAPDVKKFQQLESVLQREHQGTGLGLALTKQLVELHGGSIKVKSEVGVGSIFTVRIPLQRSLPP